MVSDQKNLKWKNGSVLNLLLFGVVIDKVTKNVKDSGVKELPYTLMN